MEKTIDKRTQGHDKKSMLSPDRWLRYKLITAFNGDVTKAAIALEFIDGHPEASEKYRQFQEWQTKRYGGYCRKGE